MQTLAFTDGDGYYQIEIADGDQPPDWTHHMTSTDVVPPTQPDPVKQVIAQIDAIERETLMNRPVREFMLAQAEQIAASSGYTPAQLYQVNLGYRKVKDIDTQIAALRAQIGAA